MVPLGACRTPPLAGFLRCEGGFEFIGKMKQEVLPLRPRLRISLGMKVLVLVLACLAAPLAAQQVPTSQAQMQLSFAPLVREAAPAVVNIYAKIMAEPRRTPLQSDPFFERFFREFGGLGSGRSMQNSLGSGVILTKDGYVVTNHHVVAGADEVRVVLTDKTEYEADIVFTDPQSDLAILKLDGASGLPVLELSLALGVELFDRRLEDVVPGSVEGHLARVFGRGVHDSGGDGGRGDGDAARE